MGNRALRGLYVMENSWIKKFLSIFSHEPVPKKTFSLSPSRTVYSNTIPLGRSKVTKRKKSSSLPPEKSDLQKVLAHRFRSRRNPDFIIRSLQTSWGQITIAFYQSLTDSNQIQEFLIGPLVEFTPPADKPLCAKDLKDQLTYCHVVKEVFSFDDTLKSIITGMTFVHIDGYEWGLALDFLGQHGRSVSEPHTETVVQGPYDAFVEDIRINLYLLRTRLATPDFIAENIPAGERESGPINLLYIDGLTNPKVIREIRRRLESIDVDMLYNVGQLEQFIEDRPFSLFSQMITSERPDRTISFLMEGAVAVLLNGSPLALIAPVTLWSQVHSPEDIYYRWPISTFARLLRVIGVLTTIFLPAVYTAMVVFHPEMLPTDLMLAIASAREHVPFPTAFSLLFLEIAFDFIREAALRVPKMIGPTIGIVGAIIIGQAVVEAGIVSPVAIIVAAITGLAGFSIPQYSLVNSFRIARLFLLFLANFLGFYGVLIGLVVLVHHLAGLKSLGVPFLSPFSPLRNPSGDTFIRTAAFSVEKRPFFTRPMDKFKQRPLNRPWDPRIPPELLLITGDLSSPQKKGEQS
ncbi:spore germination protein [Heliobacillus mobilis]|uniref:Spore germination protein n=1 Tax=Heliobacterium mobile TaxID=28064 RepID=A0A6I3SP24_HELMO|nr:spore germination protein [Heliobacterium mobile]MTV50803.1 spore germination protein [Heliobacterium mobile]